MAVLETCRLIKVRKKTYKSMMADINWRNDWVFASKIGIKCHWGTWYFKAHCIFDHDFKNPQAITNPIHFIFVSGVLEFETDYLTGDEWVFELALLWFAKILIPAIDVGKIEVRRLQETIRTLNSRNWCRKNWSSLQESIWTLNSRNWCWTNWSSLQVTIRTINSRNLM